MTSLHHDDSIEIITGPHTSSSYSREPIVAIATSSQCGDIGCRPGRPGHMIDVGLTLVTATTGVVRPIGLSGQSTGRYFRQKFTTSLSTKDSAKEKRIKKAVMVIATLMILASMILVGASLSMSEHIDEMVRQMNGFTSTTSHPYVLQLFPSNVTAQHIEAIQ